MADTYRRLLAATDFSRAGNEAVARAAELAQQTGAELVVMHVIEHFPQDIPVSAVFRENEDPATRLKEHALARLRSVAAGAPHARLQVETTTRSARRALEEAARTLAVDLIVLGVTGEPGFRSTASGVVHHAPCDVLVIRV